MSSGGAPSILGREHRRLTVGIVLVVTFFAFEEMAVFTVLPTVLRQVGGIHLYGWAFSGFVLAQLAGIVMAGTLTDRIGMTGPLLAGAGLFVAGLLVDGTARTMLVVVVGRAVQGAGAGLMSVVVNVAVGRGYPPELRPRVYAALSTAWVAPALVGPVLAGLIAQTLGWRPVFLAVIPAVVAVSALAGPAVHHAEHRGTAADEGGTGEEGGPGIVVAVGLSAGWVLVLAALGTRQPVVAPLLALAGLALGVPALRAVLPARGGRLRRQQIGTMTVAALATGSFFGAEAYLPLALQSFHHRTATEAGLALTTAALSWTSGSWVQARGQARIGPRNLSAAGLALVAAGVAGVALLDWAATPWWVAYLAWGTGGFGMGLVYNSCSVAVLDAAGEGRQGGAVAALQVLLTLGIALGTGLGGAALAWSVSLGHGRAPGLALFDATAVGAALVGVGVTRLMPGPGKRPAEVAALPPQ